MSRLLIAALALTTLAAPVAHAADQISVRQPWSRPAQAGMNGVGFLTIANTGKTPVTLRSAASPAAGKVEIHQSAMANGVMTMRRQDNGLVVPAGDQVALAPGGYHLMLIGLKKAQGAGQKVPVTLVFDGGRQIQVELAVQLAAPTAGGAATQAGHHH
ncbi:copper chaperone PCu(A)C [Caulobacter sp. RHG1]|uniref:copper chaperone PCu(A)C n=1 Tax=Caulobacter sp. (strain RHG1) TaxID=2545762 RepID=UPI001551C2E6|nr:copper chaperone PCu(A)C [Caulobacter sp. RHG1]NQE61964.1 Copper metallochaperone PCu(A)C, inserts Cu(I) into cytochrome oxidase subunit II [Caulobacter sp. RHG1]